MILSVTLDNRVNETSNSDSLYTHTQMQLLCYSSPPIVIKFQSPSQLIEWQVPFCPSVNIIQRGALGAITTLVPLRYHSDLCGMTVWQHT